MDKGLLLILNPIQGHEGSLGAGADTAPLRAGLGIEARDQEEGSGAGGEDALLGAFVVLRFGSARGKAE